jgi:aminoglycoside phosphotransferase
VPLHRVPHPTFVRHQAAGAALPALDAATDWERAGEPRADPDLGAVVVRSRHDGRPAVLRFARTDLGARSLRHHQEALGSLGAAPVPDDWRCLAPVVLASGDAGRQPWLVETHISGADARGAAARLGHDLVAARAGAAIRALHAATAAETPVDDAVLRAWVDEPIAELRATAATPLRAGADHAALDRVQAVLREELAGRVLTTCFVHGDYWLGNVLSAPDGTISGIVDWERAGARGLSAMDVMTLVLTGRVERRRREFGPVVRDLLRGDGFDAAEQALMAGGPGAGELPERTVLLLAWLHHASSNLQKRNHYRGNTVWVTTNVHFVLEKM